MDCAVVGDVGEGVSASEVCIWRVREGSAGAKGKNPVVRSAHQHGCQIIALYVRVVGEDAWGADSNGLIGAGGQGAVDLGRYKAEMDKLRERRVGLDQAKKALLQQSHNEQEGRQALGHLEEFCHNVAQGLESLTFEERQQLLRLVVELVTVENGTAKIETIIPTAEPKGHLRNGAANDWVDTFTYKASDGMADSNVATVTITVAADDLVLWVTDQNKDKVFKYTETGTLLGTFTLTSPNANGKGLPTDGNSIWDLDENDEAVYRYDMNGVL
jgi:hypothetical protein